MRIMVLTLAIFLTPTALFAQTLPEWYRVYTFDHSVIDMNTSLVTLTSESSGRVSFRWSFAQPETLRGTPRVKYKIQLELIEFDCSGKRFRPHGIALLDVQGKLISVQAVNPSGDWRFVTSGLTEKLYEPACQLIQLKSRPPTVSSEDSEAERALELARSFAQRLARTKDVAPLIKEFFAPNYLSGYLRDQDENWFLLLDRDVAVKANRAELQRFYLALLNAGYLGSLYFGSKAPMTSDDSVAEEKLIPPDVVRLIKDHPYTAAYKGQNSDYDYLAEQIDSVERMRSYTDLLERVSGLLRRYIIKTSAEQSREYRMILADWGWPYDLYRLKKRVCARGCLGLPVRTRLFEVNVPIFQLQLAEINGEMKIVSAMHYLR